MTRGRARQESLDLGPVDTGRPGRVERRVAAAVLRGKREGSVLDVDDGLAALAVELARAADVAAAKRDPYGVAAAARELREVLARLKLDPTARGATADDPAAAFLAGLSAPEMGDPAGSVAP